MEPINQNLSILVTGTNRGLGKALAFQLLQTLPNAQLLFTSRKKPQQMKTQCEQFFTKYPNRKFTFKTLDLTCEKSIQAFVNEIKEESWTFDAIVNNAAMGYDLGTKVPQYHYAKALLYSNVVGTIRLTNLLIPYLKDNGRVVSVSSKLGGLTYQSKEVAEEFSDPELEEQQIFTAVEEYIALCEEGDLGKWSKSVYGTSKMMLNAWSRFVLKRKLKPTQFTIVMSPGHCVTDMGGPEAAHSAESGAKTIYDCIFIPNPSAEIFYHRGQEHEFVNCGP